MRHHLPVVAIVGRPNAGQSTLFNRLIRQRKAVVEPTPGVTRDRNVAQARWRDHPFLLVDTGGLDPSATTGLAGLVQAQTRLAIEEADHVLFLFDGKAGINPADTDAVDLLRRSGKPVFFAVNKMDARPQELLLTDFNALGIAALFPISAAHGGGISDLMDAVVATFPQPDHGDEATTDEPVW
jgi:GTP-binding protein